MRISEVGVELALACALYSARTGQPVPADCAVAGELSLAGEVRSIRQMRRRAKACAAAGRTRLLGPPAGRDERGEEGWEAVAGLKAALSALFGLKP